MKQSENPIVQAVTLQQQGRLKEAEDLFRRILVVAPNEPSSLYSLATIVMGRGELDEAESLYLQGLRSEPTFPHNWMGYAYVLHCKGMRNEALKAYDDLLAIKADYVEALINSGALLREMHRHREALERFESALSVDPNHLPAIGNAAILLTEFKESERAIAMFKRLLELKPDYDYGLGLLIHEELHCGNWDNFEELRDRIIDGVRLGKRTIKSLAIMSLTDLASDHFLCTQIFAKHYCPKPQQPLWRGEKYQHKRIKIAYVSPDLREHPVGHLMCGVFEHHNKSRFETIAISLGVDDGSRLRLRMLDAFDQFLDVREMSDLEVAQLMRDLEVDVAIDLGGYTSDTRTGIFAHRPAPVHINYLGYSGTMSVKYMDYILADKNVIPEHHQAFYSEDVLYMPNVFLPTDIGLKVSPNTPTKAECGLPDSGTVYCSFSHDYKISPPLWKIWMSLLRRTPDSVLWLASRNSLSIANLRKSAEKEGIDSKRIIFAERLPRVEDHLARYRLADVFLDTWPYNAHTTTADALVAGLPVVTYMGNSFPSRVAGSLLHSVEMSELIASSWEEYEALAYKVATNKKYQENLRTKILKSRSSAPLFDTPRFVRDFEEVISQVVNR